MCLEAHVEDILGLGFMNFEGIFESAGLWFDGGKGGKGGVRRG